MKSETTEFNSRELVVAAFRLTLLAIDSIPEGQDVPTYRVMLVRAFVRWLMAVCQNELDTATIQNFFRNPKKNVPLPFPDDLAGLGLWEERTRSIVAAGIVSALGDLRHADLAFAVLPEIIENDPFRLANVATDMLIRQLNAVPF